MVKEKREDNFKYEIEKALKRNTLLCSKGNNLIQPWQERLPNIFRFQKNPWLFWILVGGIIFLIQFMILTISGGTKRSLLVFGIYCAVMSYATILQIYISKKLKNLFPYLAISIQLQKEEFENWYKEKLRKMFSLRTELIIFITLGIPATITLFFVTDNFNYTEAWFDNHLAEIYAYIAFLIFCFLVCPHGNLILRIIQFARDFSKLPIKSSYYQLPMISMRSIGKLFFFISFNHAFGLGVIYLGVFVAPIQINWMMLIWMCFAGTALLMIFVLPQFSIHGIMIKAKYDKIRSFSIYLENAMNDVIKDPTSEDIERFEKFSSIAERLEAISEWPFDTRAVLTIFTTILIPIVYVIIDIFIS